jgi:hypothetical protein
VADKLKRSRMSRRNLKRLSQWQDRERKLKRLLHWLINTPRFYRVWGYAHHWSQWKLVPYRPRRPGMGLKKQRGGTLSWG